ncbi:hypothetical protein V5E97_39870 [Singulisphaera sp. Ch08]|uniref:Uncharacterized protein n=1 Tax=Singulisphaera sp. Ch08 TaxID=3120278 RepID=A0AAU7CGZ0_9BACT
MSRRLSGAEDVAGSMEGGGKVLEPDERLGRLTSGRAPTVVVAGGFAIVGSQGIRANQGP